MAETSISSVVIMLAVITHVGRGGTGSPGRVSRCGERPAANESVNYSLLSRIVGGTSAKKEECPWIASIKKDGKHFCGGTIISDKHVLTAAHCLSDKNIVYHLRVYVGDHDFSIKESTEKSFFIKTVFKHPSFNPSKPFNYDIAILELVGRIKFDKNIQPACLPNPDDEFPAGSLCIALGWGRLQENGKLPSSLQQVALPLIEYKRCLSIMKTVNQRLEFDTVVCAGFPEGGRDACQGDSGGPFLCQRSHGRWVMVGVTSWGLGCARKWQNNSLHPPEKRGSPGVFTDIQRLLYWLSTGLNQDKPELPENEVRCSSDDGFLKGTAGEILLPNGDREYYSNNEKCVWTILVPKGKYILLVFNRFNLEWDHSCDLDYLVIYSALGRLIGKFCGDVRPRPLLIADTSITLKFISDFQEYSTGFSLSYQAVEPNLYPDSDCGSVAVIFEEGKIQSMNHPQTYDSHANCQWVVHSPEDHVIMLTFLEFELEYSDDCIFDYLVVYHDLQGTMTAGKFCGYQVPNPILSVSNVMQITFTSDYFGNYRGFQAAISFVPSSSNIKPGIPWMKNKEPRKNQDTVENFGPSTKSSYLTTLILTAEHPLAPPVGILHQFPPHFFHWNYQKTLAKEHIGQVLYIDIHYDEVCGASPFQPRFNHRSIAEAEEAMPNSWPWHVSINFGNKHVCNGAIVSETFVLTSANCVAEKEAFYNVGLIAAGLHDLDLSINAQKRPVKQVISHPQYDSLSKDFDVALIHLEEPFQYNPYVQPICLPDGDSKLETSDLCVVSGWNLDAALSTKLQQLEAPVPLYDVCKEYYGGITDRMFCAGHMAGEDNATCSAQSGAPLVCQSDTGRFFIFGIVSWGVGCSKISKLGWYSRVPAFIQWIRERIRSVEEATDTDIEPEPPLISPEQLHKALQPDNPPSNNSSPSQDIYVACKDVISLQSPGEIKLVASGQDSPEGIRCQLIFQAPKDHFILLNFKQLNMSRELYSVVVYEGESSNQTLKAQLTKEKIPFALTLPGPVVTIEASGTAQDLQFQLWLSYLFHGQN